MYSVGRHVCGGGKAVVESRVLQDFLASWPQDGHWEACLPKTSAASAVLSSRMSCKQSQQKAWTRETVLKGLGVASPLFPSPTIPRQ